MKTRLGARRANANAQPRIVSAELLRDRSRELFDAVARRAYEIFEQRGRAPGCHEDDWFRAESELLLPVRVEVVEAGRSLTVRAEVSGFSAGEIEVALEPRRVTIAGQREAGGVLKEGTAPYAEGHAGWFLRVVDLPGDVDTGDVTASLEGGVLALTLRKAAAPKAKRAG